MNTSTTDTTPTPRTDEACEAMGLKAFVVPVETSRQLEKELTEKTNEVERLKEMVMDAARRGDELVAHWKERAEKAESIIKQLHNFAETI